jgi:hypothetical protein
MRRAALATLVGTIVFGFGSATAAIADPAHVAAPSTSVASKKPPKPHTAAALAAAVATTSLGCKDYEPQDPNNTISIGGIPKGDEGHCTIDGERSTLTVYKSVDDLQTAKNAIPTLGCSFGKALGQTTFRGVEGPNWSISTPSSVTAPKLAKALAAKTYLYRCKS